MSLINVNKGSIVTPGTHVKRVLFNTLKCIPSEFSWVQTYVNYSFDPLWLNYLPYRNLGLLLSRLTPNGKPNLIKKYHKVRIFKC